MAPEVKRFGLSPVGWDVVLAATRTKDNGQGPRCLGWDGTDIRIFAEEEVPAGWLYRRLADVLADLGLVGRGPSLAAGVGAYRQAAVRGAGPWIDATGWEWRSK